jgi:hypothetical protein
MLVESLGQRLNSDGEVEVVINGFRSGVRVSLPITNEVLEGGDDTAVIVNNLEFGDFIGIQNERGIPRFVRLRFRADGTNQIGGITPAGVVTFTNPVYIGTGNSFAQEDRIILGRVERRIGNFFVISHYGAPNQTELVYIGNAEMLRCFTDPRAQGIQANVSAMVGDTVLVSIVAATVRTVVIYPNIP